MHRGFQFRDKAHLIKNIKMNSGIYGIHLPFDDEFIHKDIIIDITAETFATYFPNVYVLPADLNQLRVKNAIDSTTAAVSDVYELPNLYPLNQGTNIMSIAKIVPFNAMGFESATYAYETVDAFQALALAQGIANLASVIEPPMTFKYLGGRRFRVQNATYYRNKVLIYIEMTYSPELFDLPRAKRPAFSGLAELDFRRTIYNNLKLWNDLRTAVGEHSLRISDWENAEDQRNEYLDYVVETFHLERSYSAITIF